VTTFQLFYATTKFVQENPKVIEALRASLLEANDFIKKDPRAAAALYLKTNNDTKHTVDDMLKVLNDPKVEFSLVPKNVKKYIDFMHEPRSDSGVMLRLEINGAQYERALRVLQIWDRRVKENALLYQYQVPLNNIILIKAVTETLNACTDAVKLYKLNYIHPEDWISDNYSPQFIPFVYFSELKKLNGARHVRDEEFEHLYNPSAAMVDK